MADMVKSIASVAAQQAAQDYEHKARALKAANDSILRNGEAIAVSVPMNTPWIPLVSALVGWSESQGIPSSAAPDPDDPTRRTRVRAWMDDPDDTLWCVVLCREEQPGDAPRPPELIAEALELAGAELAGAEDEDDENTYLCELCEELRSWDTPEGGDREWPVSFSMPEPTDPEMGQGGCCCRACAEALRIQIDKVAQQFGAELGVVECDDENKPIDAHYRCGLCGETRMVVDWESGGEDFDGDTWWPQSLEVFNVDSADPSLEHYTAATICRPCAKVLSGELKG